MVVYTKALSQFLETSPGIVQEYKDFTIFITNSVWDILYRKTYNKLFQHGFVVAGGRFLSSKIQLKWVICPLKTYFFLKSEKRSCTKLFSAIVRVDFGINNCWHTFLFRLIYVKIRCSNIIIYFVWLRYYYTIFGLKIIKY